MAGRPKKWASDAERKAAGRAAKAREDEVVAAAKSFVPDPGPRQDRAVRYALWYVREVEPLPGASPYPAALRPGLPSLPAPSETSDYRVRDLKALAERNGKADG